MWSSRRMLFVRRGAEGSIRQTEEESKVNNLQCFLGCRERREEHPGPAGCAAAGGGSRCCREVSGSGREDVHHLANSTPVRCQSHTGSNRPFIPQPCTIDLFIPAPSLSLTISHSFTPVALPPALLLCLTTPHSNFLLSPAVSLSLWMGNAHCLCACTHKSSPEPCSFIFYYLHSRESSCCHHFTINLMYADTKIDICVLADWRAASNGFFSDGKRTSQNVRAHAVWETNERRQRKR